jgi:hypothetical protein
MPHYHRRNASLHVPAACFSFQPVSSLSEPNPKNVLSLDFPILFQFKLIFFRE